MRAFLELMRQTWRSYRTHDGRLLSGAVAFYVLLATAPLGVVSLWVATLFLGAQAAEGELQSEATRVLGEETGRYVIELVANARDTSFSSSAGLLGVVVLIYGIGRLFSILRSALNHVWGVRSSVGIGLRGVSRQLLLRRVAAMGMLCILAAAVILDVALNTVISAALSHLGEVPLLIRAGELFVSMAVLMLVHVFVYRLLPDVHVSWRDAAVGASATTVLVTFGSWLVSRLMARFGLASGFGAAGSAVALLFWIYYTAQAFFLGAEFTRVWAINHGHGMAPMAHATRVHAEERMTIDFMDVSPPGSPREP